MCRAPAPVARGGRWVLVRCGACGTEFVATDGNPPPPSAEPDAPAMLPEHVFFDEAGVFVSDTRFVSPDCAFALSDVVSCAVRGVPGRWRWPWSGVLVLGGAFGVVAGGGAAVALGFAPAVPWFVRGLAAATGFVLLALSGYVFREARRHRYRRLEQFELIVGVGGFEVRAFSDADEELVGRIAAAVREALRSGGAPRTSDTDG